MKKKLLILLALGPIFIVIAAGCAVELDAQRTTGVIRLRLKPQEPRADDRNVNAIAAADAAGDEAK